MLTFANTLRSAPNRDIEPPVVSYPRSWKIENRELADDNVPRTSAHPFSQSARTMNGPRSISTSLQCIVSRIL